MCVVCFVKALVHVFRLYLAASCSSGLCGRPVDFRWDAVRAGGGAGGGAGAGGGRRALTCAAAAAGLWLVLGGARGGGAAGRPRGGARGPALCLLLQLRELPGQLACYALAHSLGRWLVYPGSVSLMARALLPLLQRGQERLVERYGGRRAKLAARDGGEIDAVFMDRRARPGRGGRGLRLVVCCEGNAGFYEMGCLSAPLEAGYSVLGWHHARVGGGSGAPSPEHDANAVDVAVRFALQRLRFPPAHVVLYGWSIGAFTAARAAVTYPELGALVLDASFDDLVPLALKVMPHSWKGLVVRTVREHFHLDVAAPLCRYPGPVLLLRRSRSAAAGTPGPPRPLPAGGGEGNRGDELLLRLLRHRYPALMAREGLAAVTRWLRAGSPAREAALYARARVDDEWCLALLRSYRARREAEPPDAGACGPHGPPFPWRLGRGLRARRRRQLALFLARRHLRTVDATHCSPLEPEDFQLPWRL
ncbi:protein ABHD16B [Canis lupus dingo]|uniref:protein ABHD16B n=1 Tax=Canis lupus dingo TaxID=286419 RepID=UPI0020C1CAB1|nr:protein ABHD16B [Canis lupus dingo]